MPACRNVILEAKVTTKPLEAMDRWSVLNGAGVGSPTLRE